MTFKHIATVFALLLSAGALGTVLHDAHPSTTKSCTSVLGSEVCVWATMEGDRVHELLAAIPVTLVEAVPPDAPMTWPPEQMAVIELPSDVRKKTGIDHLGINWEAHGHPPATFMAPHFDFHFYSVNQETIRAIDCADSSKPSALPAGYTLPDITIPDMGTLVGLCVPLMGMHAMPSADMETSDAFGASMIIGYYGGKPIFFEPMVSQELLLKRADFSLPVPTVEGLPPGVRYPSTFRAQYDADKDRYLLIASGFQQQ